MATSKKLISEFIGTFLLVFAVGCNTVGTASGTWAALSIASTLMVSIYALGSVSGAHFNPAVTLAYFLSGEDKEFTGADVGAYMGTQLVAGAAAGLSSLALHGEAANLQPGAGYSYGGAAAAEIAYTFMLCFVVLRAAVIVQKEYFGLAIGFVIVAGGYAAGGISGGAFNPAVALGVDVGSAGQGVYWSLIYFVYEFIGAALAASVHKFLGKGEYSLGQKCVSEFLGTFFLVFTVGLNVAGGSPAGALSIGASLMCMIYALGGVSGANFNPAVSTTLALCKYLPWGDFGPYVASQLAGGLAAGVCYTSLTGKGVPLAPGAGHSMSSVAVAEIVATFVLCFVVANVACSKNGKSDHMFGLAIGFCIVAMGNAIGAVSGGSLNPAVSFGLDGSNAMKGGSFGNCGAYALFELVGAGVAYGAFAVCRDEEFAKQGLLGKVEKPDYGTA